MTKYFYQSIGSLGAKKNKLLIKIRNYDKIDELRKYILKKIKCKDCYLIKPNILVVDFISYKVLLKEFETIDRIIYPSTSFVNTSFMKLFDAGDTIWLYPKFNGTKKISQFLIRLCTQFKLKLEIEYTPYFPEWKKLNRNIMKLNDINSQDKKNLEMIKLTLNNYELFEGRIIAKDIEILFDVFFDGTHIKPMLIKISNAKLKEKMTKSIMRLYPKKKYK